MNRPDKSAERAARYDRFEARVELPMVALSLLLIPVVVMPFVEDLSTGSRKALWLVGALIWLGFALEYVFRLTLSPNRWQTIRTHKLDLLLVVLPFLRPLRLLQIVRLAKGGTALNKAIQAFRKILGRPGFRETVVTVIAFIVGSGVFVAIAENGHPGSTINNLADGLWWAFVTCTTVGYGDEFPVTGTGRVIAILLMLVGISGLSAITASVAAYFVSDDAAGDAAANADAGSSAGVGSAGNNTAASAEHAELVGRLARIESQLDSLTAQIEPSD